jgi:hypothetical protein
MDEAYGMNDINENRRKMYGRNVQQEKHKASNLFIRLHNSIQNSLARTIPVEQLGEAPSYKQECRGFYTR